MEIVVATKNAGKVKELQMLLADLPLSFKNLGDFPNIIEAEEPGASFAENAIIKARSYALQTNSWSLADDSGLEVEWLNGAPGVFSARYAGENCSDRENISKLLDELNKVPIRQRQARFVCTIAISDEKGEIKFLAEAVCAGRIALKPRGANGFGYDSVFVPEGFAETFGELSIETKQKISHRARAIKKAVAFLQGLFPA